MSLFSQVFSLLIVAIGVYAKVQKATGTSLTHFFLIQLHTKVLFHTSQTDTAFVTIESEHFL